VEIREDPEAWSAEGHCGKAEEKITLKKLEPFLKSRNARTE